MAKPRGSSPSALLRLVHFFDWHLGLARREANGPLAQSKVVLLSSKPAGSRPLSSQSGVPCGWATQRARPISPRRLSGVHTAAVPSADISLASISTLSASLNWQGNILLPTKLAVPSGSHSSARGKMPEGRG